MFWESIGTGLGVLAYWQTYVAILLFLALCMGPMFLIGFVAMRSGRAEGLVGCLSMLILPFFQVFALVVFVLTMSPIILGLSHEAAWWLPWALTAENPWAVIKFLGLLLLGAIVLAFIPILGRLQSLHTLFLGSIALIFVIELIGSSAKHVAFWPGFWFIVGLLFVGSILAWLGTMLVAVLVTFIEARVEGMGQLLVVPIAATFGFIPVFVYGAWLGAQLRGG